MKPVPFRVKRWIVFLVILALYFFSDEGVPSAPGIHGWSRCIPYLHEFGTPSAYFAGMIWFSEWPWRWSQKDTAPGAISWKGLAAALAFSISFMVALAWVDILLVRKMGVALSSVGPILKDQVCFHGPAMAVIGALLSDHIGLLRKGAALETATKAAQQSALQAQLQPHALFNTFNAMAELIHKDPAQAEDYIRHTSEWMREVLLCSGKEFHLLSEERAMVENYLAMESIRIGPRLDLEWDWDATLDRAQVPPLTLQPLVENALKHGIARVSTERSKLRLSARRLGPRMILEIENPCPKASSSARGTGTGLPNLQRRLSLAFGAEAGIEFQTDGLTALARLSLPIHEG